MIHGITGTIKCLKHNECPSSIELESWQTGELFRFQRGALSFHQGLCGSRTSWRRIIRFPMHPLNKGLLRYSGMWLDRLEVLELSGSRPLHCLLLHTRLTEIQKIWRQGRCRSWRFRNDTLRHSSLETQKCRKRRRIKSWHPSRELISQAPDTPNVRCRHTAETKQSLRRHEAQPTPELLGIRNVRAAEPHISKFDAAGRAHKQVVDIDGVDDEAELIVDVLNRREHMQHDRGQNRFRHGPSER
mmetsp:Transcript_35708/g.81454  ORF Transcript_35708/g.81454 Transcript_35708/m.81454 type:complete len:244 (-) Transcript_35708:1766-2497(-)